MTVWRRQRGRAGDSGASAVEFALVVVPLLLIVFGIINFGVVFSQQLALNNAVRQGARAAVTIGNAAQTTCAGVVSSVRSSSSALAMDTSKIDVTVQTQSASGTLYAAGSQPCGNSANPASNTVVCTGSYQTAGSDSIVVTATYAAKYIVPMPVPGLATALTLTSKAVYRCEFT